MKSLEWWELRQISVGHVNWQRQIWYWRIWLAGCCNEVVRLALWYPRIESHIILRFSFPYSSFAPYLSYPKWRDRQFRVIIGSTINKPFQLLHFHYVWKSQGVLREHWRQTRRYQRGLSRPRDPKPHQLNGRVTHANVNTYFLVTWNHAQLIDHVRKVDNIQRRRNAANDSWRNAWDTISKYRQPGMEKSMVLDLINDKLRTLNTVQASFNQLWRNV